MAQEKQRFSRRTFLAGTCGTVFGLGAGIGGTHYLVEKSKPPVDVIPPFRADGFWMESARSGLTDQIPLRGNHKAGFLFGKLLSKLYAGEPIDPVLNLH
jgi:hypothetical protein